MEVAAQENDPHGPDTGQQPTAELRSRREARKIRILAKDAAERIGDAVALVAMLCELEAAGVYSAPSREVARLGGAVSGQHLVSVLVAVPRPFEGAPVLEPEPLREALRDLGAYDERLPDGSLVVTLHAGRQRAEWSAVATDQAYRIARCALLIKDRWPDAAIAIGTGRGQSQRPLSPQRSEITAEHLQHLPVGEAIDRACRLLAEALYARAEQNIFLDDLTAGLIDHRYKVQARPGGAYTLTGEAIDEDAGRLLLGQAPPCVGREQELEFLEQQLQVATSAARLSASRVCAPADPHHPRRSAVE